MESIYNRYLVHSAIFASSNRGSDKDIGKVVLRLMYPNIYTIQTEKSMPMYDT